MKQQKKLILIQVECCTQCHNHSWCSRHDQSKYNTYFEHLKQKIEQNIHDVSVIKNNVPDFYEKLDQMSNIGQHKYFNVRNNQYVYFPKFGAFQVYINQILIFSKLKSGLWPKIDRIVNLVQQIIKAQENGQDINKFSLDFRLKNESQTFFVQTYRAQIIKQRTSSQPRTINQDNMGTPGRKNFNLRKIVSRSTQKNRKPSHGQMISSSIINNNKFNVNSQNASELAVRPKTRDFRVHMHGNVKIQQDENLQSQNDVQVHKWNIIQQSTEIKTAVSPNQNKISSKIIKNNTKQSEKIPKTNHQKIKNTSIRKIIQKKGIDASKIKFNNFKQKQQLLNQQKQAFLNKSPIQKNIQIDQNQKIQQQKQNEKQKQKQGEKETSENIKINAWSNKQTDQYLQSDNISSKKKQNQKNQTNIKSTQKIEKKPSINDIIDYQQSYQNQFILQNSQKQQSANIKKNSQQHSKQQKDNTLSFSKLQNDKQIKMRQTFLSSQANKNDNKNYQFKKTSSELQYDSKKKLNIVESTQSHQFKVNKNNITQQNIKNKIKQKQKQKQLNHINLTTNIIEWVAQYINGIYQLNKINNNKQKQIQIQNQQNDQYQQQFISEKDKSNQNKLQLSQNFEKFQQSLIEAEIKQQQLNSQYSYQDKNNVEIIHDKIQDNKNKFVYQNIQWIAIYKKGSFLLTKQQQQQQLQQIQTKYKNNQQQIGKKIQDQEQKLLEIQEQNEKQQKNEIESKLNNVHKSQANDHQSFIVEKHGDSKINQDKIKQKKWIARYINGMFGLIELQKQEVQVIDKYQNVEPQKFKYIIKKQEKSKIQQDQELIQKPIQYNKLSLQPIAEQKTHNVQQVQQKQAVIKLKQTKSKQDQQNTYWIASYENQIFKITEN